MYSSKSIIEAINKDTNFVSRILQERDINIEKLLISHLVVTQKFNFQDKFSLILWSVDISNYIEYEFNLDNLSKTQVEANIKEAVQLLKVPKQGNCEIYATFLCGKMEELYILKIQNSFENCKLEIYNSKVDVIIKNNFIDGIVEIYKLKGYMDTSILTRRGLHITNINTQTKRYDNVLLHDMFDKIALQDYYKTALVYKNNSYTYKQVYELSNNVCNYLMSKKRITESLCIAVICEENIDYLPIILGILKAGFTFIPLDASIPYQRLRYILNDSKTNIIFTDQNINLNSFEIIKFEEIKNLPKKKYIPQNISNSIAYIIYTSGTTGKPKGVKVPHSGVVNFIYYNEKSVLKNKGNIFTQVASISFDVSIWEYWMSIANSGTLHIIEKKKISNTQSLNRYMYNHNISVAYLPVVIAEEIEIKNLKDLKILYTAGSKSNLSLCKKLRQHVTYVNAYGPTETSIIATMWIVPQGELLKVSIGKPIVNNKVYIVDENEAPQPEGIFGEIYISGVAVSNGYLNQTELNNKVFIKDLDGSPLFKTGDIGRWLPNGEIEYLSRKDSQVKINGFRIELQEIENQLLKIKFVETAIVVLKKFENKEYICAFLKVSNTITDIEIKRNLANFLPKYMIPSFIEYINTVPTTNSGKIDYSKLSVVEKTNKSKDKIENEIKLLFLFFLKHKIFNLEDSFFDIGGDSLNSFKLLTDVNNRYKINIKIDELYSNSTISELTSLVKIKMKEKELEALLQGYNKDIFLGVETINGCHEIYVNKFDLNFEELLIRKGYKVKMIEKRLHNNYDDDLEISNTQIKIDENDIIKKYECSTQQKRQLEKINRTIEFYEHIFISDKDSDEIIMMINELINRHGVLKSIITKDKYNIEFKKVCLDNILIVDSRDYSIETKAMLQKKIENKMKISIEEASQYNNLLFRLCIIKLEDNKYILKGALDHLIYDKASEKILKLSFDSVLRGGHKSECSYSIYIEDMKNRNVIDNIWVDNLLKHKNIKNNKNQLLSNHKFCFKVGLNNNMEILAFEIMTKIANALFGTLELLLRITENSRNILDGKFDNTIGDFHISVPYKYNPNLSASENFKQFKKEYVQNYTQAKFLEDYLYLGKPYKKKVESIFNKVDLGYNFAGHITKEDCARRPLINERKNSFFITAFVCEENLIFEVRLRESNREKVVQEINTLIGEYNGH